MCKIHADADVVGSALVTQGRQILPAHVIPRHYDLTVEPDFKTLKYDGTVVIDLDVVEDTTSVSLNTLEIDISSTKLVSGTETIRSVLEQDILFRNAFADWTNT